MAYVCCGANPPSQGRPRATSRGWADLWANSLWEYVERHPRINRVELRDWSISSALRTHGYGIAALSLCFIRRCCLSPEMSNISAMHKLDERRAKFNPGFNATTQCVNIVLDWQIRSSVVSVEWSVSRSFFQAIWEACRATRAKPRGTTIASRKRGANRNCDETMDAT